MCTATWLPIIITILTNTMIKSMTNTIIDTIIVIVVTIRDAPLYKSCSFF